MASLIEQRMVFWANRGDEPAGGFPTLTLVPGSIAQVFLTNVGTVNVGGCWYRDSKECNMAQQLREPTRSIDGSRKWLASLVGASDAIEGLSQVPCDPSALRAMRARLSRPTSTQPVSRRFAPTAGRYSPASCNRGS